MAEYSQPTIFPTPPIEPVNWVWRALGIIQQYCLSILSGQAAIKKQLSEQAAAIGRLQSSVTALAAGDASDYQTLLANVTACADTTDKIYKFLTTPPPPPQLVGVRVVVTDNE